MSEPGLEKIKPYLNELKENFNQGITKSAEFRKAQLHNLIRGINEMRQKLTLAVYKDLGRTEFITEFSELNSAVDHAEINLANLDKWMKDDYFDAPLAFAPSSTRIKWEPLGVVLIFGSWNYPYYVNLKPLVQAIATGNCAVIKPSELSPASSQVIEELVNKYLDNRCYRVIQGGVPVSIEITKNPWDLICFTGSTDKGKLVAKAAADNLIPCILELGGKCPLIVSDTADADFAAFKCAS
jgi:aldehyde dehydrogenase (NAD+)